MDFGRQFRGANQFLDPACYFPEILACRTHVDVDHPLDLVMIDFRRRYQFLHVHDRIERGRALEIGSPEGNVLQIDEIVDGGPAVLIVLDGQEVVVSRSCDPPNNWARSSYWSSEL